MSLYAKSLKDLQRNKHLLEKISFLKDDEENDFDIKDFYGSCPEKNELEDSFSDDCEEIFSFSNYLLKKNDTPFSKNKSISKIIKFADCDLKEYSLECEDAITPTALEILEKSNFTNYITPSNNPLNTPSKSKNSSPLTRKSQISPMKKSLFKTPKIKNNNENENILNLLYFEDEENEEKNNSILGFLESKKHFLTEN